MHGDDNEESLRDTLKRGGAECFMRYRSNPERFLALFFMGRNDYHPVLNIYYYIVTGYEPMGVGPLRPKTHR